MVRERKLTARQSESSDDDLGDDPTLEPTVESKAVAGDPSGPGENDSVLRPRRIDCDLQDFHDLALSDHIRDAARA